MEIAEAARVAKLFEYDTSASPGVDDTLTLKIDTFRHPYVQFAREFTLPGINVYGLEFSQAQHVAEVLKDLVPAFTAGCDVLPEARPRKDPTQLHCVRSIDTKNGTYLYILRVAAKYFGGAEAHEYVEKDRPGFSPSIRTDRIYFQARLLPVQNIERKQGKICDFSARPVMNTILKQATKSAGESHGIQETSRLYHTTAMFDEADFSEAETIITEQMGFGAEWKAPRVFRPFAVDYGTVCVNLVYPHHEIIDELADQMDLSLQVIEQGRQSPVLEERLADFWASYYNAFEYEPSPSKSGNPHWKLTAVPDQAWLQARNGTA